MTERSRRNDEVSRETSLCEELGIDMIVVRVSSAEGLTERLQEYAGRLKASGSAFLIVDWERSYQARPQADSVFNRNGQLRNEIIWVSRKRQAPRGFTEQHATVLWYVNDPSLAPFTALTMPRSMETRRRFGNGRIISSMSRRTGKRAPARIEGASLATPLNDVWVWDQDCASWMYELEEMDGRVSSNARVGTGEQAPSAEYALFERLLTLAGYGPNDKVLSLSW